MLTLSPTQPAEAPEISQEAARQMLAALKLVLRWHDQLHGDDLEMVQRAIAAASKESQS